MSTTTVKFTKVDRGHYATPDGKWAVVVDGYERTNQAEQDYHGVNGREWAVVRDPAGRLREDHNAGENMDWFDTKREAVEAAHRFMARVAS